MGAIVVIYCMSGGMQGAMMTDVIQGSLMIGTAVITFIVSIVMGGGFENINSTLQSMNEAYLSFPGANGYMHGASMFPISCCGPSSPSDSRICLPSFSP